MFGTLVATPLQKIQTRTTHKNNNNIKIFLEQCSHCKICSHVRTQSKPWRIYIICTHRSIYKPNFEFYKELRVDYV